MLRSTNSRGKASFLVVQGLDAGTFELSKTYILNYTYTYHLKVFEKPKTTYYQIVGNGLISVLDFSNFYLYWTERMCETY